MRPTPLQQGIALFASQKTMETTFNVTFMRSIYHQKAREEGKLYQPSCNNYDLLLWVVKAWNSIIFGFECFVGQLLTQILLSSSGFASLERVQAPTKKRRRAKSSVQFKNYQQKHEIEKVSNKDCQAQLSQQARE